MMHDIAFGSHVSSSVSGVLISNNNARSKFSAREPTSAMDLIPWMLDMNIEFSKNIEVRPSKLGGTGIFSTRLISNGDVLMQIPKAAVLSANTCGISNLIAEHPEIEMLNLPVVAYLFEKSQGKESPWYPYIKFVERAPLPDVPRLWSDEERAQLKGTNIELWDGLDSNQLMENYERCMPLLEEYAQLLRIAVPSYEEFARATLIVSSRAFDVDNYHELALAPGACFFNHSDKETVHFESDGVVCPLCGSLNCGCIVESDDDWEEDGDEESGSEDAEETSSNAEDSAGLEEDSDANSESTDDEFENACVLRAQTDVGANSEIFNTYGADPNGILLARYGFAIWNNIHEVIDLGPQVEQFAKRMKLSRKLQAWQAKQEDAMVEDDAEEDPLFLGIVNTSETPKLSKGLSNLARKFKINAVILVRELITQRLKTYALQGTSAELEAAASIEPDLRRQSSYVLVGTEKLLLEKAMKYF